MRRRWLVPGMCPGALPANALEYQDAEARRFYRQTQPISKRIMKEFDALSPQAREVDRVVRNVNITMQLLDMGITTSVEAEPVVRRMLETGTRPSDAAMKVSR